MSIPFLDLGAMSADVRAELDQIWSETVDGSGFIGGPAVAAFENDWADYCGTSEAIGVADGTDALLLALVGLGIGSGDEVIVPANTFVATVEAIVLAGATPRFVDVDPATLLITADHIRPAITDRTAAIMPVHLYGQPANMTEIMAVASVAGLAVIEDAAQAHGATWDGKPVGSFGAAAGFSFYPGKNLGAFGDAGATVTNDALLAETIRPIANHGRTSHHGHGVVGWNSRLDALQARVLHAKLRCLPEWNMKRRALAARYLSRFADSAVEALHEDPSAVGVYHLFVVQVDDRDDLARRLNERDIQTGIHYPTPVHHMPPYAQYAAGETFPVTEASADRILSLPMYPHLSHADADAVADELLALLPEKVS